MLDKNSIYGFSPEQNTPYQDFVDDIEFEKSTSGRDPLDSQDGVRVIVAELSNDLSSENLPVSSEAALILIGLTHKLLTSNRRLSDEVILAFQTAVEKDPLSAYEERQKFIKMMDAQIQDQ